MPEEMKQVPIDLSHVFELLSNKKNDILDIDYSNDNDSYPTVRAVKNYVDDLQTILDSKASIDSVNNLGSALSSNLNTIYSAMGSKEDNANKVTSLSSSSTDTQYPSAKIVYDSLQNLRTEFITGTFGHINSNAITANTSETIPTGGDKFYVHITDTSISTTDARISVIYNNQYNVNGALYRNGTALKPNELKADTILLIELVFNNGYSWNIIEAFDGDITKEQYPIKETLKTKLGDEWAYVVSEVIHSGKKALCKITNLSSSELSLNDKIYIKIPSYQTDSNSATHIQLSDMYGSIGISMRNTNNQTIKESDINGKIIYATYGGSQFTVSNIYSTNRLMALISELPTKTSDLQNDSGFLTSHQDISGKENTSNKTSSWNSTTNNTRYPTEKLVKDSLDGKANSSHTHTKSQITDFPAIPSQTSDLTNDSGFITSSSVPSASSTTPSADTTNGSVGTGVTWARSNHTHPKSSLYAEASHTHSEYVNPTIVDNLTTNDATKVLSAKQGKVLNDMIGDAIEYINQ